MTHHPQRLYACLLSFAAALCGASVPSAALASPAAPAAAPRKDCIGLVLGGGGARGAAHIGFWKYCNVSTFRFA